MEELLWRTMSKFVRSKHLLNQTEDDTTRKIPAIEFLELDACNQKKDEANKDSRYWNQNQEFVPTISFGVFQKNCLNCMRLTTEDL